MEIIDYLPVEIVFHLLCIFRRRQNLTPTALRSALRKRGLRSAAALADSPATPARVAYWVRLCQAASLLDDSPLPYPTLLVEDWLAWSLPEQIQNLLSAWAQLPAAQKERDVRAALLQNLQAGRPINPTQQRELDTLNALGILRPEVFLGQPGGQAEQQPDLLPGHSWVLAADRLVVPFPPDWLAVWELERYLDPAQPGVYPIEKAALRLAAQRGALLGSPSLPEIIMQGTGSPMPLDLARLLHQAPVIRLVRGFVLEFTHPEELAQLRRSPFWRRAFEGMLSPRHVALDPWQGEGLLRRLHRQGLLSEGDLAGAAPPDYPPAQYPLALSKTEQVYLLNLALLSEALQNAVAAPPGLLARLAAGLDHPLRAAAARKASAALAQLQPVSQWSIEEVLPELPAESLVSFLEKAVRHAEAIDVLYQASGRHTPELRHITPLLVEQRGGRYYLIAYCHTRRANRTFRLDRLKIFPAGG